MNSKRSLPILLASLVLFPCSSAAFGQGPGMGPGGGHDGDHFSGHHGLELEHNLVLPQLAVGKDVSTRLILSNLGNPQRTPWLSVADLETDGVVHFFYQDGESMAVQVNGAMPDTQYSFRLGAGAVEVLDISSKGPNRAGWILITIDDPTEETDWGVMDDHSIMRGRRLQATAFYTIFDEEGHAVSQVGVAPAEYERERFYSSTMAALFGGRVNTGLALVNTSGETVSVTARLRDSTGQTVVSKSLSLPPGNQIALFVDQLFVGAVPNGFEGSLEFVTSDEGVVSMGLLTSGALLTSFPTHHFGSWRQGGFMP